MRSPRRSPSFLSANLSLLWPTLSLSLGTDLAARHCQPPPSFLFHTSRPCKPRCEDFYAMLQQYAARSRALLISLDPASAGKSSPSPCPLALACAAPGHGWLPVRAARGRPPPRSARLAQWEPKDAHNEADPQAPIASKQRRKVGESLLSRAG